MLSKKTRRLVYGVYPRIAPRIHHCQTNAISLTYKTREVLVQHRADKLVDCSTDVDQLR